MKVWQWLDGKKRVLTLLLTLGVLVVKDSGHGDYSGLLGTALSILNWQAASLPIPAADIALIVTGVVAIGHAVVKGLRERADTAEYVTPPKA